MSNHQGQARLLVFDPIRDQVVFADDGTTFIPLGDVLVPVDRAALERVALMCQLLIDFWRQMVNLNALLFPENRLARKRRIRSYHNPKRARYAWHWRRHMQAVGRQHQSAVVAKRQRRSRR